MKRLFAAFQSWQDDRPFFAKNLIASAGTLFTLFLAYLFHFVMTRLMPASAYGDLSVLMGIFAVATVPAASISSVLTRELSKLEGQGESKKMHYVLFKYLRMVTLASVGLFLLVAAFGWFSYAGMTLKIAAVLMALGIPAVYYHNLASSYFQAKENIFALMVIGIGRELFKFILSVALVVGGYGLIGASASFLLGYFIAVGMVMWYFARKLKGTAPYSLTLKRSFFILLLTSFLTSAFMYLDLFFVKTYLGSVSAGVYNVAEVTSKLLVYLAGGIVLVVFPKSAKLSYSKNAGVLKQLIWKSVLFLIPAFLAFVLLPGPLMTLFYPKEYVAAVPVFFILSFGMFFLAVFTILQNVMWSQNQERFPFALIVGGVAFHAALLNFTVPLWHLEGAAYASLISSFLLCTFSAVQVWRSLRAPAAV